MPLEEIEIRPIRADERADWEPLWKGSWLGGFRKGLCCRRSAFARDAPPICQSHRDWQRHAAADLVSKES